MSSFYVAFCSIARKFAFMNSTVTIKPYKGHPLYKYRVSYPEGTKRRYKGFKLKKDAVAWAEVKRAELANYGAKHQPISEAERRAVATFREFANEIPDTMRPSLPDAIGFFIDHVRLQNSSMPCDELAEKLIARKQVENKSKRHIDDLVSRLRRFTTRYGDWLACDVSTDIIDEFLEELEVSAQTKLNYRNKINQLFRYAVQLKACKENPVENSMKPDVKGCDVGILTPDQIAGLLAAANDTVLPGMAIAFFAGLRESEIQRLDWKDVDLDERRINVLAKNAKSAQRRSVLISENLRSWLITSAQADGKVIGAIPWRWRSGKEEARRLSGIVEWPPNAARHSYASYHLEAFGDAGKTALQLGHTNQRVVFQHYRALVKPKDAETYWSIMPEEVSNVTDIKAS